MFYLLKTKLHMLLIAVVSLDTVSLMDAGLRNVKLGIAPVLLDNSFSKSMKNPEVDCIRIIANLNLAPIVQVLALLLAST